MKRVVLLCAAGMSTSLLVTKIKEAADKQNYEISIDAYPVAKQSDAVKGADIVLLGPQIRYELNKVQSVADCPVETIDMRSYGMMDGEEVIAQIRRALGDSLPV